MQSSRYKEMNKELTEEQVSGTKIIPMARNRMYEEKMEEVKKLFDEGKTLEEAKEIFFMTDFNNKVLLPQDLEDFYRENSLEEEKQETEEESLEEDVNGGEIPLPEELETQFQNQENPKTIAEKVAAIKRQQEGNQKTDTKEMSPVDILIKSKQEQDKQNQIQNGDQVLMMIKDEDLIDFENQDFPMYDEEEKETMKNSLAIHGIIEKLIVRPMRDQEGKYQIISGRNRRMCGREIGIKEFPCIVRNDLKDDDEETELLLIDTNIATRKDLDIISKAKVIKRKKDLLESKNSRNRIKSLRTKYENSESAEKIIPIYDSLGQEFDISKGNIIRLLKLTDLIEDLQDEVRKGKINAKTGEQLGYLSKPHQRIVSKMMQNNVKLKVSESQAKKIRLTSNNKDLTKEDVEEILLKKELNEKKEDEIQKYVIEFTLDELKKLTNKLVEESKEVNETTIKEKIISLFEVI